MKLPNYLTLLLLLAMACSAENEPADKPEVKGTITDQFGNPYPNVKVKLFNTSLIKEIETDQKGMYELNAIKSGDYKISFIPPLSTDVVGEDTVLVTIQENTTESINFAIQTKSLQGVLVIDANDIFGEVKNETGQIPTDIDELIYAKNVFDPPLGKLTAILSPAPQHLTLGEWSTAQGSSTTSCNGNSAKVDIMLTGMIPDGTYTCWLNFLNKKKIPGQSVNFANDVVKIEPLGSGVLNILTANPNGVINTSITHSSCILTEETALVLVIDYHINGNTFGANHIPDEEDVSHMLIYFQQ